MATTATTASKPLRFRTLMREAGRDVSATRSTLALFAAASRMQDRLEASLAGTELTPAKFNVLMELAATEGGRLPLCQLAGRLIRSAPNVSGLIDRMEAQGLVRRVRDDEDRRVVFAEITEAGWDALPQAARAVFASEQQLLEELEAGDKKVLVGLLDAIARPTG